MNSLTTEADQKKEIKDLDPHDYVRETVLGIRKSLDIADLRNIQQDKNKKNLSTLYFEPDSYFLAIETKNESEMLKIAFRTSMDIAEKVSKKVSGNFKVTALDKGYQSYEDIEDDLGGPPKSANVGSIWEVDLGQDMKACFEIREHPIDNEYIKSSRKTYRMSIYIPNQGGNEVKGKTFVLSYTDTNYLHKTERSNEVEPRTSTTQDIFF